jgi:hypothetical protein
MTHSEHGSQPRCPIKLIYDAIIPNAKAVTAAPFSTVQHLMPELLRVLTKPGEPV